MVVNLKFSKSQLWNHQICKSQIIELTFFFSYVEDIYLNMGLFCMFTVFSFVWKWKCCPECLDSCVIGCWNFFMTINSLVICLHKDSKLNYKQTYKISILSDLNENLFRMFLVIDYFQGHTINFYSMCNT